MEEIIRTLHRCSAFYPYILFIWILTMYPYPSQCKTCDKWSTKPQCNAGQICINNNCTEVIKCTADTDYVCLPLANKFPHLSVVDNYYCNNGFCQPFGCTSTGQCVHQHICQESHKYHLNFKRCQEAYREYSVNNGSDVTLEFIELAAGIPGTYTDIKWYSFLVKNILLYFH